MAVIGLVLVGSACAVGYRNTFAGSVSPTLPPSIQATDEPNVIPTVGDAQAASSGNTRESFQGPLARSTTRTPVKIIQTPSRTQKPPRALRCPGTFPAMPDAGEAVPAVPPATVAAPASRLTIAVCPVAPWPIARRRRHTCIEPGASGRRPRRTCQFGHQCGGDRYRRSQGLCGPSDIRA